MIHIKIIQILKFININKSIIKSEIQKPQNQAESLKRINVEITTKKEKIGIVSNIFFVFISVFKEINMFLN